MEEFFEPVTTVLKEMLHPEVTEEEQDINVGSSIDVKGGKAAGGKKEDAKKPAKAPPKGAKGTSAAEVAAYESPLPMTTAGVESVVIMVDQLFETLL